METNPQLKFKSGLKRHWHSRHDFSHHKTFGSAPIDTLPDEYLLVTDILNQGGSEKCTAYSAVAIAEAAYGKKFDSELFYSKEGVVAGGFSSDGYELRTTMQTGIDQGFQLLASDDPVKEGSYFFIDGPYDLFDNIRSAMWIAREDKKCAEIGTELYLEWLTDPMIPISYSRPIGLHAMKCAGWKKIGNDIYLVMQQSYGSGRGDNGLFYFPRSVVNREFVQGHYLWRKKPPQAQIQAVGAVESIIKNIFKLLLLVAKKIGFNEV